MKKIYFLTKAIFATTLMLSMGLTSMAHDFEVNGIYYGYVNKVDKTVKVTFQGSAYDSYADEYTGAITIPSSVTFSGVTYSVTTIGKDAFRECSGVTSVTIPKSVTEVMYNAFYNTQWYKNQPDGVMYLGDCCLGIKGANPTGAINIKNGTRLIANTAFSVCNKITDVTIPNTVTHIGTEAFYACRKLTKLPLPESLISIGAYAFQECSGLTDITFPNSVSYIGAFAIYNCTGLTSIQSLNPTPPTCVEGSLYNCYNLPLIVADGSAEKYANALEWKKFTNIQEAGINNIEADKNAVEVSRYDINGRQLSQPTTGINIIKMSDGTTKKIIVK